MDVLHQSGSQPNPDMDSPNLSAIPFNDILKVVIPQVDLVCDNPQKLVQTTTIIFHLALDDLEKVNPFRKPVNANVLLRFCSSTSNNVGERNDEFPPDLSLFINGFTYPLNYAQINRNRIKSSKPLDITEFLNFWQPNMIKVKWVETNPREPSSYQMSAFLCKPIQLPEMSKRIVGRNPMISREWTIEHINQLLTNEDGIKGPESVKISVVCPISKDRIKTPCKGARCRHLACFDLDTFLQTYKSCWKLRCPICNEPLKTQEIGVDQFVLDVLNSISSDRRQIIEVHAKKDGEFFYTLDEDDDEVMVVE